MGSAIKPVNISVMNVDAFLRDRRCLPVTSLAIHEPSSATFHPDGLFSEVIFGQIGTPERLIRFGYIELNATILSPSIYKSLVGISAFYDDLMAGRAYAVWNEATHTFDRVFGNPDEVEDADTGFSFFMRHFSEIDYGRSVSDVRENRVKQIQIYANVAKIARVPVIPAGTRDVEVDGGRVASDDVNKLYQSLLSLSLAIPRGATSELYDGVRYNMQKKVVEIYEHYSSFFNGKHGFAQGRWAHRRVALGTRNVITAANYTSRLPDDPQLIKSDETQVGLFQTMKGLQPAIIYHLRSALLNPIIGEPDAENLALIDPDTKELGYAHVPRRELEKFIGTPALEAWINRFRNTDVRDRPMSMMAVGRDGKLKPHWMYLVYDEDDEITLCRSITDLEQHRTAPIDPARLRPMTWIEGFYLITHAAAATRHVFITRYPVLQDASCYPTRIHVMTTTPARVVRMRDLVSNQLTQTYAQYPILGAAYCDSVQPHSSQLAGLGADFDGDMVSANFVLSTEANAECAAYLASPKAVLNAQRRLTYGSATVLIELMFTNMSRLRAA